MRLELSRAENSGPKIVHQTFAMRRSGQRAIILWLQGCYESSGMSVKYEDSIFNATLPVEPHWPDPDAESLWQAAAGNDVLITNYQDVPYGRRGESVVYNSLHHLVRDERDSLIVRDWYNLAASRLKYIAQQKSIGRFTLVGALDWHEYARRWKEHAAVAIRALENPEQSPAVINYNHWFGSSIYRERIAARYGLVNSDEYLDEVSDSAYGSSFDGLSKQGHARTMNVLSRWNDLSGAYWPAYRQILEIDRHELDELNRRLFGLDSDKVLKDAATVNGRAR